MTSPTRPAAVLIGPPGAGKSTVGTVLARRLDVGFVDVDAVIVERIGKPIADMFVQEGEEAFRALEQEVVADCLRTVEGVLALGGGSVLSAATRVALRGHRVVLLTVGLTDGLRRTGMSTARPLLAGVNPRATFRALLEARMPLYREVAGIEVDTEGRSANAVARTVLEELGVLARDAPADPVDPDDPLDRPTERPSTLLPDPTLGPV